MMINARYSVFLCIAAGLAAASALPVSADERASRWRPEVEVSYLTEDQHTDHVFLTARFSRVRPSFSFAGFETSVNIATKDTSAFEDFVHIRATVGGIFSTPIHISETYHVVASMVLGAAFGDHQEVDGDVVGTTTGVIGAQVEPRLTLELKDLAFGVTPIVSIGYLRLIRDEPSFGIVRLGVGLAF